MCATHTNLLSNPKKWTDDQAKQDVYKMGYCEESNVCTKCRRDLTKMRDIDEDFVPNWMKDKSGSSQPQQCYVSNCLNPVKHRSNLENMSVLFSKAQLIGRDNSILTPTPLCGSHYETIYRTYNPKQYNCVTCGTSLRRVKSNVCPNPPVVEAILNERTEY